MDPTPPNSIVYGVTVVLYGAFDCDDFSPNAIALITLQKETIYNSQLPTNLPCFCGNCVGNYTVALMMEHDWPGYNHSGVNAFQINVQGPNAICLNRAEVFLEYYPGNCLFI
jgi:hypothetical protein